MLLKQSTFKEFSALEERTPRPRIKHKKVILGQAHKDQSYVEFRLLKIKRQLDKIDPIYEYKYFTKIFNEVKSISVTEVDFYKNQGFAVFHKKQKIKRI